MGGWGVLTDTYSKGGKERGGDVMGGGYMM